MIPIIKIRKKLCKLIISLIINFIYIYNKFDNKLIALIFVDEIIEKENIKVL